MREDESVKYYIKSSGAFETSSFENISAGTAEKNKGKDGCR